VLFAELPQDVFQLRRAAMVAAARGVIDVVGDDLLDAKIPARGLHEVVAQFQRGGFGQVFVLGDREDLRFCERRERKTVFEGEPGGVFRPTPGGQAVRSCAQPARIALI